MNFTTFLKSSQRFNISIFWCTERRGIPHGVPLFVKRQIVEFTAEWTEPGGQVANFPDSYFCTAQNTRGKAQLQNVVIARIRFFRTSLPHARYLCRKISAIPKNFFLTINQLLTKRTYSLLKMRQTKAVPLSQQWRISD